MGLIGGVSHKTVSRIRRQLNRRTFQSIIFVSRSAGADYNSTKRVILWLLAKGEVEEVNTNSGKVYRLKL